MRRKVKPVHYKNTIRKQTKKKIKLIEQYIYINNELEELSKKKEENKKRILKLFSKQKAIIQTINEINIIIMNLENIILNK